MKRDVMYINVSIVQALLIWFTYLLALSASPLLSPCVWTSSFPSEENMSVYS